MMKIASIVLNFLVLEGLDFDTQVLIDGEIAKTYPFGNKNEKRFISPIAFSKVLSILNTEITDIEVILKREGRDSKPIRLGGNEFRATCSINDHQKLLPKIAQNAVNEALVGKDKAASQTLQTSLCSDGLVEEAITL